MFPASFLNTLKAFDLVLFGPSVCFSALKVEGESDVMYEPSRRGFSVQLVGLTLSITFMTTVASFPPNCKAIFLFSSTLTSSANC